MTLQDEGFLGIFSQLTSLWSHRTYSILATKNSLFSEMEYI